MCAGQTCIAPKRFLVDESIADEFETRLVEALEAVVIGDPREEGTQLGPLARLDILENLERQVAATVARGRRAEDRRQPPRPHGLLLPADRADRRRAGHDRVHRRDVRPGRRDHPLRRRGHRRRARQRHPLRARRHGLEQRHRARARARAPDRLGRGVASTRSSPPTRGCRSAASSAPATAASSPPSACTSSRTSGRTRSPRWALSGTVPFRLWGCGTTPSTPRPTRRSSAG